MSVTSVLTPSPSQRRSRWAQGAHVAADLGDRLIAGLVADAAPQGQICVAAGRQVHVGPGRCRWVAVKQGNPGVIAGGERIDLGRAVVSIRKG